ncbi:MAG: acyl-CoA dehydrogenase family protein [Deltaproteobacteria bacterium]|jgi:acyl-CoA dehydrogenase|nr:acyl-CoA dehydrogenase family protein [Deltaproteobacteria bacterium]
MDILKFTQEHDAFRKRLKTFLAKEVTPNVDQWEKDHIVPRKIWQEFGKAGFLCTSISGEYGGIGGNFLYSVIVSEEISYTVHSGLAVGLHSDVVVPYIDSFGSQDQKAKYLPGCVSGDIITAIAMTEPDAGSDLSAMTTTAVEDGESIIINGSKTFISNGINCDLVVLAAADPAVGNRHEAISLYLLEADTPGFKRGKQLDKMGWNSQDTAELFFSDCCIPKTNRLGDPGAGFIQLMIKLQQERLVCAMGAVFAAERIMEFVIDYCKKTMISGKPLTRSQAVQFAIVEMTTQVKLGKTFMEKLCVDHMEGKNIVIDTSMAKYWTTDMVNEIAERSMDLCGESALLESNPIARAKRDVRVMSIFAGTNEIMKGISAKFMGL